MGKPKRKPSKYNLHVGREMRKGKTMKQAAASWDKKGGKAKRAVKAVRKTVKSVRAKRAASKTRRKTKRKTTTGGRRKVSGFNTQKIMKLIRMAALGAPVAKGVSLYGVSKAAAVTAIRGYTGVNINTGKFRFEDAVEGWTPYLFAIAATYGIPKIAGLIRGL